MRPESIHAGHRVSWPVLVALILVPLIAVGSLLGFTRASGAERVNAAIVNLDQMVTIDGQAVPLGRQLAAAMMGREGRNITWTLADAKSAKDGLASGEYAAVVTIPETFSAAATSFSANDAATARQATVQVQVSDNSPVTDSALAQEIARLAADTLNSTLTKSYLDNVYIGFNSVKDQFTTIVDGAEQLSDGATQLADGTGKTSQGATQLADGMQQLKDAAPELKAGGAKLSDGGQQLVDGTTTLDDGAADLATGASQLADGAKQLSDGLGQFETSSGALVDGVGQLATGADPLLSGLPAYTAGVKQALEGVAPLKAGIDQILAGLDAPPADSGKGLQPLVDGTEGISAGLAAVDTSLQGLADPKAPVPADVAALADKLPAYECAADVDPATCALLQDAYADGATAGVSGGFKAGIGLASTILNTPDASGSSLVGGAKQIADAVAALPGQLQAASAAQVNQLRAGLTQLSGGAGQIIEGSRPLVANAASIGGGATQLLDGINELNDSVAALPGGVSQLADGASQLSDGATQLADGAGQLSDGVGQYADGVTAYADGVGQYVAGVDKFTTGVDSAATGAQKLSDGIVSLDDGAEKLADGTSTFASKLAEGATSVPTYTADQREALSSVVASPVDQSDSLISGGTAALTALLLVAGLWLGALAAYVVARPLPSTIVSSRASSAGLWARTLAIPAAIAAGEGVLLGIIGSAVLSLDLGRSVGLILLLATLGLAFTLVNHALAAWFGNIGRGVSLVLLVVTVALGLSSAAPGWLRGVAAVSPVQNGLELTRTWISSGSGLAALVGGLLLIVSIAGVASYAAIAARRQVSAAEFRRRVAAA